MSGPSHASEGRARGVTPLGLPRLHLRLTDSTNERARELALAGAPHGTLVTADEQSAGRGRQGRRWSAPAGSALLMSVLLREPPRLLPLAAALAVCDVAGGRALIKWPNDVVVLEEHARASSLAKLGGILVEARVRERWAVLGIGLNVAVRLQELPPELRRGGERPAATLGLAPDRIEPTLQALLGALERRLEQPGDETLTAWRERDALLGRTVSWAEGRGVAKGLDGEGRLLVQRQDGARIALAAGEVHLERPR